MGKTDLPRVAVIGAGPIGLEAALHARTLNLPVTLYERGRAGEHLFEDFQRDSRLIVRRRHENASTGAYGKAEDGGRVQIGHEDQHVVLLLMTAEVLDE